MTICKGVPIFFNIGEDKNLLIHVVEIKAKPGVVVILGCHLDYYVVNKAFRKWNVKRNEKNKLIKLLLSQSSE